MTKTTTEALPLTLDTIYAVLYELLGDDAYLAVRSIHNLIIIEEDDVAQYFMSTMGVNYRGDIIVSRPFWDEHMVDFNALRFVLYHEILHHICGDVYRMLEIKEDDPERSLKAMATNIATDARSNAYTHRYVPGIEADKFLDSFYGKEELDKFPLLRLLKPGSSFSSAIEREIEDIYNFLYLSRAHDDLTGYRDLYKAVLEILRNDSNLAQQLELTIYIGSHGNKEGIGLPEGTTAEDIKKAKIKVKIMPDRDEADPLDPNKPNPQQTIPKDLEDALRERVEEEIEEGKSAGSNDSLTQSIIGSVYNTDKKIDVNLLKTIAFNHIFKNIRLQSRVRTGKYTSSPVIPNVIAKTDIVAMAMGQTPILWRNYTYTQGADKTLLPIYLDVSGSMWSVLPEVIRLVVNIDTSLDYVWGFSNAIHRHTIADLKENRITSTGGTDFDCIIKHALKNEFKSIVVITDGYAYCRSDSGYGREGTELKINGIDEVIVVLTGTGPNNNNFFSKAYLTTYTLEEVTL